MTRYFIITFIVCTSIFLISSTKGADECGPHEVKRANLDFESDCCPQPECEPSTCPDPRTSTCKCGFNYLRAANNTCIPARECPAIPCNENEVFDTCPVCSELCSNASPDGKRCRTIGHILIVVNCKPACRCIDNFWRNENKECVYYDQCPQFQDTCSDKE